ncbi:MAG: hypothetical protein WBL27_13540 [Salinimicrobium sp.]
MKSFSFIFLYLISVYFKIEIQNNQNNINEFERRLGKEKVESLNLLVSDFEEKLQKLYPKLSIEEAYKQCLTEIKNDSFDWSNFNFQTDSTHQKYLESGLRNDLYSHDPESGMQINRLGDYMKALYHIKSNADKLTNEYYEDREMAGVLQNKLFAAIILQNDPDFKNYFHKRFVVVEFSY